MAATTDIPEDVIKTYKCFLCQNILSVPPIMVMSLALEQYKCGRCKDVKCTTYMRSTLFENIIKSSKLPCTFNKCTVKIPWGDVEKHERTCFYRTIQCPLYYLNCHDVIEVRKLQSHFLEKHEAYLHKFNDVWDLYYQYDYVLLVIEDNQQFLVYILHINNLFSTVVLALDSINKYKNYSVKLSTNEYSILYENQKIIEYDERQHCFKCISGLCTKKYHPYSQNNNTSKKNLSKFTTPFGIDLVTTAANNGIFQCVINLTPEKPEKKIIAKTETNTSNKSETNPKDERTKHDLLRKSIECPICQEYMVAPIFSCKTGHTICNVCKPKLEKCPTCKAELGNTRNFTLEDLAENIKLPCQFESRGCKCIGNTERMYKHEMRCAYKDMR